MDGTLVSTCRRAELQRTCVVVCHGPEVRPTMLHLTTLAGVVKPGRPSCERHAVNSNVVDMSYVLQTILTCCHVFGAIKQPWRHTAITYHDLRVPMCFP